MTKAGVFYTSCTGRLPTWLSACKQRQDAANELATQTSCSLQSIIEKIKDRAGQDGRVSSMHEPSWLMLAGEHPVRSRGAHGCARVKKDVRDDI